MLSSGESRQNIRMVTNMRKKKNIGIGLLAGFLLWTWAVCVVDVQPIGPLGSRVGLARLNGFFHRLTGVHFWLYTLTDWLSLIPLGLVGCFGFWGLAQWIRRKSLARVDRSLLMLGGFYLAVLVCYGLFEVWTVNYRPVLIEGLLEGSYPSSTTMLSLCVMPTAWWQLRDHIRNPLLRRCTGWIVGAFTAFLVVGRVLSGVHWLSDIVGGMLLSGGLLGLYRARPVGKIR